MTMYPRKSLPQSYHPKTKTFSLWFWLSLVVTINAERDAKIVQLEQKVKEKRIKGEEKEK